EHPHIAKAYAVDDQGELTYIAMELAHGSSLEEEIARRAETGEHFSFEELSTIISQIGSALGHAHDKGVVHRDLKPANIHLEPVPGGWSVKVLDFGIAKISVPDGDQTTVGRMLGSWLYMSPEQVLGEPVTKLSDLFGFAAVVFELVTLRKLFARGE